MFKELENWKAFYRNIEKKKKDIIMKNEEVYLRLNRKQMRAGFKKNKGYSIYRHPDGDYAQFKKNKSTYKASFPKVDLYLTGDFQEGMQLQIKGNKVVIDSRDEKNEMLQEEYSDAIFGLNAKHQKEIQDINGNSLLKDLNNAFSR